MREYEDWVCALRAYRAEHAAFMGVCEDEKPRLQTSKTKEAFNKVEEKHKLYKTSRDAFLRSCKFREKVQSGKLPDMPPAAAIDLFGHYLVPFRVVAFASLQEGSIERLEYVRDDDWKWRLDVTGEDDREESRSGIESWEIRNSHGERISDAFMPA